jgi:hypothetical protein
MSYNNSVEYSTIDSNRCSSGGAVTKKAKKANLFLPSWEKCVVYFVYAGKVESVVLDLQGDSTVR